MGIMTFVIALGVQCVLLAIVSFEDNEKLFFPLMLSGILILVFGIPTTLLFIHP